MRRVLMMMVGVLGVAQADAALVTRNFSLSATSFVNFNGTPSPITSLSAAFQLVYDDMIAGFQGPPAQFSAITNGVAGSGPFAAAAIFGYFPADGFSPFPRFGVGGALNGGNTLLNGTDDFYFTFDASAVGPTSAVLSITAVGYATPFIGIDAVVTPVQAAAALPEPASWAMFLLGFGAIGGAVRRRQQVRVSFG